MPSDEKKGITVKIDAGLHAEVRQYLEEHGMTMAEFVTLALDDELHPKIQMKEGKSMENMRTIAVQVPEDLFQRIKEYLQRNNMTQKGLIEDELERDLTEREGAVEPQNGSEEYEEDEPDEQEETALADDSDGCEESEDESEDETQGLTMGM